MAINKKAIKISQKHLLGIQDLSISDINLILDEAKLSSPKTKDFLSKVKKLKIENALFIDCDDFDKNFELAIKNIKGLELLILMTLLLSQIHLTISIKLKHNPLEKLQNKSNVLAL